MAQLSTTMSQAQSATAFHCCVFSNQVESLLFDRVCKLGEPELTFFTSNFFLASEPFPFAASALLDAEGASLISTSAMLCGFDARFWLWKKRNLRDNESRLLHEPKLMIKITKYDIYSKVSTI